jgi:hypothetical protein
MVISHYKIVVVPTTTDFDVQSCMMHQPTLVTCGCCSFVAHITLVQLTLLLIIITGEFIKEDPR